MKRILLMVISAVALSAYGQALTGTWHGQLDAGAATLRIVMHLAADGSATLDSPDQGAYGLTATVTHLSSDSVSVEMPTLRARYAAHLRDGRLVGVFTQGVYSLPLNMQPGQETLCRPQTPRPPFPYSTEEVTFTHAGIDPETHAVSPAGGATLSGTLVLPADYSKDTPVVLLISGSGPQDRDEQLFGHRPFLVIADRLARHGIASLRYDDRGVGRSTGDDSAATLHDHMLDAMAGLDRLRQYGRFGRIGVLGHSEGGTIGYMLAARGQADFVVSLAGPVLRGDSILMMQNRDLLLQSGIDSTAVSAYLVGLRRVLDQKVSAADTLPPFSTVMSGLRIPVGLQANLRAVYAQHSLWLDHWLAYDPTADLRRMSCPVMVLGGDRDLQVRASANLAAARQVLSSCTGDAAACVKSYPRLNHLFQPCQHGDVAEYGQIETTISEEVLADIVAWIKALP